MEKKNKTPTMSDIAKRVGVSRQLVSLVLSNSPGPSQKTREKVLQAAEDLEYTPHIAARMLRSKQTGMIGVIYTLNQIFHSEIIEQLYPLASKHGYSLILSAISKEHTYKQAIRELIGFRSDAIVILDSSVPTKKYIELAQQTPVVVLGRRGNIPGVDFVESDDEYGVFQAVDHMVNLGHKKIAFLAGDGIEMDIRKEAYLERMYYHGLRDYTKVYAGTGTEESGCMAAKVIIEEKKRPTAVVASNDSGAIGMMHALRSAGIRIPEDISIIGYDNTKAAGLSYINLTTVYQQTEVLADAAMRCLLDQINNKSKRGREKIFLPELIVRKTTASPSPITDSNN